ncbi:MAG: rhamnulokinase [Paramuribaculum sp.]|nr:rhamnulokinase [Paramuribaculum sp.]
MKDAFIAADFGGSSGRIIAGCFTGNRLELNEIHRFKNGPVSMGGSVFWDFPYLFAELKTGLHKALLQGYNILSIGIDTWGVDFGLIDKNGQLVSNPFCYRDPATQPYPDSFFETVDRKEHYAVNGTQVMPINTLFRLMAIRDNSPWMLDAAEHLLFTPDLFAFYLTGVPVNEYCIASTSELLDATTRSWDTELIESCGFPTRIFGKIVPPGTVTGYLTPEIMAEIGAQGKIPVVAVASHDTASAVFAVNRGDSNEAFLSSGTWSLLGALISNPVLTEKAMVAGFTNEGAADYNIRFLQNITGLWILQRLVLQWEKEGIFPGYDQLISEAFKSNCKAVINVDSPEFSNPSDMQSAIVAHCKNNGLDVPHTQADFMMTVCRSLANRYKQGIEALNSLLPSPAKKLVIMGGGSKNRLLTELTAQITGLEVITGPVEATAIGNILMQAKTHGLDITNISLN